MEEITISKIETRIRGGVKVRLSDGINMTFATTELMQEFILREKESPLMRKALLDVLEADPKLESTDRIKDLEFSLSAPVLTKAQR